MNRDAGLLLDIWQAIHDINEFTNGLTKSQFIRIKLVHSATIQKLMIIGEATKQLSKSFQNDHSDIPWKLMAGMRDKIIHEYFDVDFDEVWKTIKKDLPILISQMESLVPKK